MFGPRKIFVGFLSLILFFTLMGTAFTSSFKSTFGSSSNVEKIVSQSNLYDGLINRITSQAQSSIGDTSSTAKSVIKPIAESSYTQTQFQQDINEIINSNYSWLEGHSSTPSFSIEVNSIKLNFASQVGAYVNQHLSSLSACSQAQDLQFDNNQTSLLSLTCLPKGLSPSQAATEVSNKIDDSNLLISTPVITANNLQAINHGGQAYYTKLSSAPKVYRWATKVPYFLILIDLILAAVIIFLLGKKKGLRRVGVVLIVSGLLLVIIRLCSNKIVSRIDSHISTSSTLGSLKSSFINIASLVEKSLVKTDLKFGLIYLVLGAILIGAFFALKKTLGGIKPSKGPKDKRRPNQSDSELPGEEEDQMPLRSLANRSQRSSINTSGDPMQYDYGDDDREPRSNVGTAPPLKSSTPSPTRTKRKPPRLVQ